MAKDLNFAILLVGLAFLLAPNETCAYRADGQGSGLSVRPGYGYANSYNAGIQEQPIYERPTHPHVEQQPSTDYFTGCPAEFTGLLPYAYDCHRFVNCFQGRADIQSCGPGTAFNPSTLVCDHPEKVSCGANALLGSAEPQRSARLLQAEPKCAPGLTGLQPHPTDCTKFLNCASGQTYVQACGPGTGFSPAMLTCDHLEKVDCGSRSTHENREAKFYAVPGGEQWNQWGQGETTTATGAGDDRWSNMNMQRPAGIGYKQPNPRSYQDTEQTLPGGWSGMGSSFEQRAPTQSVLYVEGSLQPNRNYQAPIYQTPLAPMGQVYYAQPVNSVEERWQPLPRQTTSTHRTPASHLANEGGQRPLNLDYNPLHKHSIEQQPSESQQRPLDLHNSFGPWPVSPAHSPTTPKPNQSNPNPSIPANHRPIYAAPPTAVASNLYGGLLPPLQQLTTPSRVLEPPTKPTPSTTTTTTPTPTPHSNVHTFQIYPPVANVSTPQQPSYPHYSPAYAGVSHSRKAPPAPSPRPLNPRQQQKPLGSYDYDNYEEEIDAGSSSERRGLTSPPFNHLFYNPSKTPQPSPPTDPKSQLPISEALRLLLRPYFNHSGAAQADVAVRAESHIMSVINKPPTSSDPPATTPRSLRPSQQPDDDAELIVAGEQESLDKADDDSVVADAGETARTEQTLNPTTYTSNDDVTDFQLSARGTRRVDTDRNRNNWHAHGHTRGFHMRHPNLPDPFDKPHRADPHRHGHRHHPEIPTPFEPHHHQHNEDFHRRHPQLPNPFEQKPKPREPDQPPIPDNSQEPEFVPSMFAEPTTPHTAGEFDAVDINVRGSFDALPHTPCEFDCGDGKCIKQLQVCDGINNCGHRQDERQCEHLGYEVRLAGGESPHMGRIEVKVKGQWSYVCDDKFGLRDADVICRELGHKMGALEVRGSSFYAPQERNFNYAMDGLECSGNETKLKDCAFKGWGVHNCGPDEVVGVVCKVPVLKCPNDYWLCATSKECLPPAFVCDNTVDCADKSDESDAVCKAPIKYRLEGGRSDNEGRLEVKYRGVWGSICDDDFSLKSAQVACNALGYYGAAKIEKNIFGPSKGPIWLDQVSCFGNETSLDQCSHWNWGEHNCNHTEDLGLRCKAGPSSPRQRLRLQPVGPDAKQASSEPDGGNSLADIGLWERSSKSLNTPRRCGIFKDDLEDEYAHPEQRVVQGAVARRGRHPWQATIRTRGRGHISSHWCGAVVISKRHLLTAAHCLYGHPKGAYFVRVGDHYANIAESSEVDSFIENWYVHEKFRDQTHMNNDIALVVLKTPLKFSDYVQPICLPERGAILAANRSCTISGWGSIKSGISTPSQILRAAKLPILPDATCKQQNVYGNSITDNMFCAGQMDESVDACEGDSGGPLVCSDEDGETLYGIISWGQHCGYINKPGVYVRVCHYIDWIYEKINHSLQRG